jgi:hypothetical protein
VLLIYPHKPVSGMPEDAGGFDFSDAGVERDKEEIWKTRAVYVILEGTRWIVESDVGCGRKCWGS